MTEEIAPTDGFGLIIVPVGRHQLEDVVVALAPNVGDATLLVLSSNWEGTDALDRHLPADRYLLGYPDGGGTVRNGTYWVNLGSEVHLGGVDGTRSRKLERVCELFERADMKPDVRSDILHWLWVHNASTVAFQAGFAKHLEIRAMLRDREVLKTSVAATRELLELCERRGVEVKRYPDVASMRWPTWLVIAFMRVLFRTNKSMERYTAHAASPGSLREAAENYEAMMRTARELGVETPNLVALGEYLRAGLDRVAA